MNRTRATAIVINGQNSVRLTIDVIIMTKSEIYRIFFFLADKLQETEDSLFWELL